MKRTVDVELDAERRPVWNEGALEIAPEIADAFSRHLPLTLLELHGEYHRPDRHTKVLRVTRPPRVIAAPLERALAGYRDVALLTRFLAPASGDTSPLAWTLRAMLAVHEARFEDARDAFLRALRAPGELRIEAEVVLGLVYDTLVARERASLEGDDRRALLSHVYRDGRLNPSFRSFVHPLVASAYEALAPARAVPPPWHFGGPRVATRSSHPALGRWLMKWFELAATAEERDELGRMERLSISELEASCEAADERDRALEEEAQDAATARWIRQNPDSEDSPPDGLGDPGPLEGEKASYAWARFRVESAEGEAFAAPLVRLLAARAPPKTDRAFSLALDAVVILAEVAPELVEGVDRVVLVDATFDRGLAVVRSKQGFCALFAEGGPFGSWRLTTPEEISRTIPALADRILAATSRRGDDDGCDVVHAVKPERALRRKPPPAPPAPKARVVVHPKFGRGTVLESTVESGEEKLTIAFDTAGRKVLLARFVKEAAGTDELKE